MVRAQTEVVPEHQTGSYVKSEDSTPGKMMKNQSIFIVACHFSYWEEV